jgi:hypothetical protein
LQNGPVNGVPQLTQKPGIVSPERSKSIVIDGRRTFPQIPKKRHDFIPIFQIWMPEKDASPGLIPG